jgi:ABC-type transport system substrate-binding protein
LFYGPNGKVKSGGENAVNYSNKVYDKLFGQMKNRSNDLKRKELIDKMVELLRYDAPWAWGISSESLILSQRWVSPNKPNSMSRNTLKYMAIDVSLRNKLRSTWNTPIIWPLVLFILLIALLLLPFIFAYRKKALSPVRRTKL